MNRVERRKNNMLMMAYTEYSTDPRVQREADALVEAGYNVDFITLKENDYFKSKITNNVNILYVNQKKYMGSRQLSYMLSYLEFFIRIFLKSTISGFKKRYRIVQCDNMPNFIVFSAIVLKLLGAKVILDIHDTMPELYVSKMHSDRSVFWKLLLLEEKLSANFADRVIAVHEPQKRIILRSHGLNLKKVSVVANFADEKLFHPYSTFREKASQSFNLIWHGTIAERFGLDIVLRGLKKVVESGKDVELSIYGKGDGYDNISFLVVSLGLQKNVKLHGAIPLEEIPSRIAGADLGIVSYMPSISTDYNLPLKLMEYIAMELPALTVKNKTIEHYFRNGELEYYKGDSADSFAEKLLNLIEKPERMKELRANARKIRHRMNWNIEKEKYKMIIEKLLED
ncbi:glycosyltransferase, group 1 family protein [delta proteobacterium NaphS2]|nr:glycosyltransferase, group 1 family protein [delta proteobacterium NaphS2]